LLLSGFPFVKAELLHRNPAQVWMGHWEAVLQSLGCDTGAVHAHLAEMNRTRVIIVPKRSKPSIFKKGVRGLASLMLGSTRADEIRQWNRQRIEHRRARRMKSDEAAPQSLRA
jgi:hypothetical protein